MKHSRPLTVVLVALALIVTGGPAVAAAEEPVDPQLSLLLEEVPGGVVTDGGSAVWPKLDMEYRPAPATSRVAARPGGSARTTPPTSAGAC